MIAKTNLTITYVYFVKFIFWVIKLRVLLHEKSGKVIIEFENCAHKSGKKFVVPRDYKF